MFNLEHLKYFLVLARLEHYGRAAEQLHISQPGLSHAIGALEKNLGTPLFRRAGRGIVLSEYGRLLLPQAERIVALTDHCTNSFGRMRKQGGLIRISSVTPVASTLVARLSGEFRRLHPACDFQFSVGVSSEIYTALKEQRIDIGFCSQITQDPEVLYTSVQRQHMLVVLPLGHPLAERESLRLEETLDHPHITFSEKSGLRASANQLFQSHQSRWNIAYEVEDADFIMGLVAQGFGIAVMPEIPVTHLHQDVQLRPLSEPHWENHFYIMRHREKYLLQSIEDFHRFFVDSCPTEPGAPPLE